MSEQTSHSESCPAVDAAPVCAACGYDLAGSAAKLCPECGLGMGRTPAEPPAGTLIDPHPMREIIRIAAPSVATMTSYTLMTFVDALMVSRIEPADPVYLAAQGNGGMAAWVPQSIMAGMLGVVNTYVAQNLGAGNPRKGAAYAWNGLWMCLILWTVMLPYGLVLPWVFKHMGHSEHLIELEIQTAWILLGGAFIQMSTRAIAQFFYGVQRPKVVLAAALAGNVTNLFMDWVLIFGHLGAPKMGVPGAAVATVIGCAVEFSIPMFMFLSSRFDNEFGTRGSWRISWPHMRDILRIGWPGGLMFLNEMLCWGYFMVGMIGSFGEIHNTAGWIALRYMHLSFMPAVGISNAMTSIVGRYLGMKRPDLAAQRARLGLIVAMTYMGICALCFVFLRYPMVRAFEADPRIVEIGAGVMIVAAVFQIFDALGITLIGTLRGAGDTIVPGVVTILLVWACLIGLGHFLMWKAPGLESLGPWIGAATYIIMLGIVLLARFLGGRWKTLKLVKGHAAAGAHA